MHNSETKYSLWNFDSVALKKKQQNKSFFIQ